MGERLERIKRSPQYYDTEFKSSPSPVPLMKPSDMLKSSGKFFFGKSKRSKPEAPLPSIITDLHAIPRNEDVLVWFGHSSYYIQVDGIRFLIDPVFCGHASPFRSMIKSFPGSNIYTASDIPDVDVLLITHDHYDHLDCDTVCELLPRVKETIVPLGVAAHLEFWGFGTSKIHEKDWHETVDLDGGFSVTLTPSVHFSGRSFKRNQSLWTSYVLRTPTKKFFLGGDSGFGEHFKLIGQQHGPFDLAIMECGQYNEMWHSIHSFPEEAVTAASHIYATNLLPVHWAKFALALHAWDEPIKRVLKQAELQGINIVYPMIGEKLLLKDINSYNASQWWKLVQNK